LFLQSLMTPQTSQVVDVAIVQYLQRRVADGTVAQNNQNRIANEPLKFPPLAVTDGKNIDAPAQRPGQQNLTIVPQQYAAKPKIN